MASFELGKEIEREVFRLVTSVPQRKKLLNHMKNRIEPQILGCRAPMLYHRATETLWRA